jgi:hypothetical protein
MIATTVLLRQIHPSFVQAGFATSQAFRPTPKDESKLSVYDGDQITPDASFIHYTELLKLASVGTTGISMEECLSNGVEVHLDPLTEPVPFTEHAVVDFTGLTDNQCRKISKKLQAKALARGWLFEAQS